MQTWGQGEMEKWRPPSNEEFVTEPETRGHREMGKWRNNRFAPCPPLSLPARCFGGQACLRVIW